MCDDFHVIEDVFCKKKFCKKNNIHRRHDKTYWFSAVGFNCTLIFIASGIGVVDKYADL